ncbi:uncharacterized protein Z518_03841 [Rhinocladiella mackenziei CBS 650.93]|uniref:Uncharacterized protein n=1 Tax=Rhinocladiella mackenziei CBS 650.93 TaxID=1442369 RepID=A0A0D2H641_9EURO|nr:uncharacterized protein Z518_03841 [Rhinocladiella mackenziei CBS 650.93]KIX05868.1 hypothetical protein Z518_03841 [Rhinocladiella mackenziei CBS 650.93]
MAGKVEVSEVAWRAGVASGIDQRTHRKKRMLYRQISQKMGNFKCDVSSPKSITSAYAPAKETFTWIDYSVQCAGIIVFGAPSVNCFVEDFDKQYAIKIMRSPPLDSKAYPEAQIPAGRA